MQQDRKGIKVRVVLWACKGIPVPQGQPDRKDPKGIKVLQVRQVRKDHRVLQVQMVVRDHKGV